MVGVRKPMRQGGIVAVLGVWSLLVASCARPPADPSSSGAAPADPSSSGAAPAEKSATAKLRVVATYSILGDLVRNVAGDLVEVVTLVGPDGDAHTFEPTPKEGILFAEASAIFENGAGLETWLDKMYSATRSSAKRVVVTEGLEFREGQCHHSAKEKAVGHHEHEDDPHVWHDVRHAIHMVNIIRDRLVEIEPRHADQFRANSAAYLEQLEKLHAWVEETVSDLPKARRKLVTNHDTFGYFADRYGFKVIGAALPSVSTEAEDPSAAEFAKLVDAVKAAKVPAIFTENVHSPKLMERLARETGIKLAPPLYTDALGKPGSAGESYEKMVRYNVTNIVKALGE